MTLSINQPKEITIVAGDRPKLSAQLVDNTGTAQNLAGITVTVNFVDTATGTETAADGSVAVDTSSTGKVTWTPSATPFATAGTSRAIYFMTDESPVVRRPYDGAKFIVRVIGAGDGT